MNELIITMPNGIEDPAIATMRKAIADYAAERIAAVNADAATVDESTWKAHRLNAFDADAKKLSEAAKRLSAEVAEKTGAGAVLIQLKASENEIKAAIEERNAVIRGLRDANEVVTRSDFALQLCASDKELGAVIKTLDKLGVQYRWVKLDRDADKRAAEKLFA